MDKQQLGQIASRVGEVSDKVRGVSDKFGSPIEGARDRAAEAVRTDGDSFFKEVRKLSRQLDDTESKLKKRIDAIATAQASQLSDIGVNRTTWPRKFFWLSVGAGLGAAAAYFGDAERGTQRWEALSGKVTNRAKDLGEQASTQAKDLGHQAVDQAKEVAGQAKDQAMGVADQAREAAQNIGGEAASSAQELSRTAKQEAREVGQEAATQAEQLASTAKGSAQQVGQTTQGAADQTRGAAIAAAKGMTSDTPTADQRLLEQRIKSEVFGHRNDVTDVVIKIDGPGHVALKGTVPTSHAERDLLASVSQVEGVTDVRSELSVRTI